MDDERRIAGLGMQVDEDQDVEGGDGDGVRAFGGSGNGRKEVESYYKQRGFEFRAPKFYKEELNLLKLYRAIIKLGGYEQVTSCKLWRQVGAPFRPPKTCTTVSWTFRNFNEKALLEYEKHRMRCGELPFLQDYIPDPKADHQVNQAPGSGRTLRDACAMQGWQSHGLVNWEDKRKNYSPRSDKQPKGALKHKKPFDGNVHRSRTNAPKPQLSSVTVDVGPPADLNDCFEIYALVPGLLREEVHVQSDPAGRLIISGQPQTGG
ncbi:hypothetical protein MLD38_021333 [Melastoma candidum]|uniref:Uncharacterized protein n=1 Tax=Melastoma candidum TaxID=119954 RepID=A0ACB9QG02_9MYRT|nr:hypothetical protein MLD38_021333 [Melastoma candidum]